MMYSHPIGNGRSSVCSAVSFILFSLRRVVACNRPSRDEALVDGGEAASCVSLSYR